MKERFIASAKNRSYHQTRKPFKSTFAVNRPITCKLNMTQTWPCSITMLASPISWCCMVEFSGIFLVWLLLVDCYLVLLCSLYLLTGFRTWGYHLLLTVLYRFPRNPNFKALLTGMCHYTASYMLSDIAFRLQATLPVKSCPLLDLSHLVLSIIITLCTCPSIMVCCVLLYGLQ